MSPQRRRAAPVPETGEPEYLTTRELAAMLRIKDRKVYDMVAAGTIPCSRAMGKLLFRRHDIEAWLAQGRTGPATGVEPHRPPVFLGSHDPLLEWTLRQSRSEIATFFDGSVDGLDRYTQHGGIAVGLHLYSPADDDWNRPAVLGTVTALPVVLLEFAWRDRGWLVRPGNPKRIRTVSDLRGRRVTPRQERAGSQILLAHLMARDEIDETDIEYTDVARTEADAAIAVLDDRADVAFGLRAFSRQYHLDFIPVMRERFDLLVDRRAWFEPLLQRVARFCRSPEFAHKAAALDGYDVSGFGAVHFNGP